MKTLVSHGARRPLAWMLLAAAAIGLTGCVVAPPHARVPAGTVVTGTATYPAYPQSYPSYPQGYPQAYPQTYPAYPSYPSYPSYPAYGGGVVVVQPRPVIVQRPVVVPQAGGYSYGGHGHAAPQVPSVVTPPPRVAAPVVPAPPPVVNPRSPTQPYGMQNAPAPNGQPANGKPGFRHDQLWR